MLFSFFPFFCFSTSYMVNKNEYKYVVRKLLASCRSDIELLSVPGDTKMHLLYSANMGVGRSTIYRVIIATSTVLTV